MRMLLAAMVLAGMWSGPARSQYGAAPYCQILDRIEDPIWETYLGYATREDVKDPEAGDSGMVEIGAHTGLFYFYGPAGVLDLRAGFDTLFFTHGAGLGLPLQVTAARLDLDYIMRFEDGYALRLKLEPGFYSTLRNLGWRDLYVPFGLSGIRAVSPDISIETGIAFFPGFDRLADPRILMRWELSDLFLLDAGYPGSRLIFRPDLHWAFTTGFEVQQYMEYRLKRGDERRAFRYEETRFFAGIEHMFADHLQWMFEAGHIVNRSVHFGRGPGADLDNAYYFRIAFGGLL